MEVRKHYVCREFLQTEDISHTDLTSPNFGNSEDWLLVGISDTSNKIRNEIFSMSGHAIMIVNNQTEVATVIHWSFKKITRVVSSSLTAEMLSLQQQVADYLTKQMNITNQMLQNTARFKVYSVQGGMAFSDSTWTSVKTWGQLMKVEEYLKNRIPIPVNVTYSTEDDENYLFKISILDSNLLSNDSVEVWIVTKPQKYYDFIIVLNVG